MKHKQEEYWRPRFHAPPLRSHPDPPPTIQCSWYPHEGQCPYMRLALICWRSNGECTFTDIPSMCRAYERKIEDWGGVDIQLLGIGHDGHIGFNEPCDHFPVMTHEVKLTDMTREANKRFFTSINEVPTAAITMGIGTVMAAKKIVMIITGADKADILHKVFFGPVMPEVPGSILQFHSDVTLICDEAAAAKMPQEGQQCSI